MGARLLGRHVHRLFVLHQGAVVVVHTLVDLAGDFVCDHGVRIDLVDLAQSILRQLKIGFAQ